MKTLLKSALKSIGSPVVDATGIYDKRLAALVDVPGRLLVVMYHRVIDDNADPASDPFSLGMCVRRQHFDAQIKYLKSRFNVVPLSDAVKTVREGGVLPPATAAITFDDGYLDNLTNAAPVLNAQDLPATFFVPTGGLAEGLALWWDRIIAAIADTELACIELPELGLTDPVSLGRLNRRASLVHILDALWAQSQTALPDQVDRVVARLVPGRSYRVANDARAPRMSLEQLRELTAMGFAIGAHTVSHVDLRYLDANVVHHELTASRDMLETLLEQPIKAFAYPSGFHNEALRQTVRAAGFEYAVSTDRGINDTDLNAHAIYRIGMPDSGVADFKRALSGVTVPGETGFSGSDAPVLTSLLR